MIAEAIQENQIAKKTIILSIKLGKPGNRKKVSSTAVEVNADRDLLHVGKDLLDAEEYREISRLDTEVRNWLSRRAFPSQFREGMYLLPIAMIEEVDAKLEQFRERRGLLIESFLSVYPLRITEAQNRLRDLFNPMDYPEADRLRGSFSWESRYLTLETPGKLEGISRELYQREAEKAERFWQETAQEIRDALRVGFQELVTHMADRLGYGPDGKPKIFRDTMIENLEQFFESFRVRNLTDDTELDRLVSQARSIIRGVSPQELREDRPLRDVVREQLGPIREKIDGLIISRPRRAISLEDE